MTRRAPLVLAILGIASAPLAAQSVPSAPAALPAAATITVRNHHSLPYRGPVEDSVPLRDGWYAGGGATAEVRGGVVRAVVDLPAHGEVRLTRRATRPSPASAGPLAVRIAGEALALEWNGRPLGAVDFGLVVRPGTTATTDSAVAAYAPTALRWTARDDGALVADADVAGYTVSLTARPYAGGWLDVRARVRRAAPTAAPGYLALVRRVSAPGTGDTRSRFNGRVADGLGEQDGWDRDFWYVHGLDWLRWRAGDVQLAAVNAFTPVPTIRRDTLWAEGSHFYVWERARQAGDRTFLVSEIAGPNPNQSRSSYMRITPYAPMREGDAVELAWRLAVSAPAGAAQADAAWAESQLRVFAGWREARGGNAASMSLGVPAVAFGTSYFPYSTLPENFDYVRTPGLDKETWWAISPTMWTRWREFVPRMRTDLHIIRAMGFGFVRLHHLELLRKMPRAEALAFLDFYFAEARALGLRVMVDTEGPEEWMRTVLGRYARDIARVELENEILMYGVTDATASRLADEYRISKEAAPDAEVILTTAGNHAVLHRLLEKQVPFDRVGLHAYKHGPAWIEAFGSHALGTGGVARAMGKPATLGEFNWKSLARTSPTERRALVGRIYDEVLAPRALPELFEFHFSETLSINTQLARDGTRHYEPLGLDRRPKPEAMELLRVIREHSAADAPVRALPVRVGEVSIAGGRATAPFTVANHTGRRVTVRLASLAFDGLQSSLAGASTVTLASGATHAGTVRLALPVAAMPGAYHHFVRATYDGVVTAGWGIAAKEGAPVFQDAGALPGHVAYAQGAASVRTLDWTGRPLAVTFGDSASVLELESAYTLANTLQASTGRRVWLSRDADLPDSLARGATLVLVGTAASHARLARLAPPLPASLGAKGLVAVHADAAGRRTLLVTGGDKSAVLAAATDLALRYWRNAKDATLRVTGEEPGAALGNRARVTNADLP